MPTAAASPIERAHCCVEPAIGVPSAVAGNIGREGRSQRSFESRRIHENHPIKDSAE